MKQVIEQYASAVLTGMLAVVLLMVIGKNIYGKDMGISQVLGLVLQDSIGEKTIVENDAMETYVQGTVFLLKEKNVYITVDQEISISDCFEARNSYGELVPIYLGEIWNQNWEAIDAEKSSDNRKLCISKAGAYWLQIYTVDKNKKQHIWLVRVLVNER